MKKIKWYNTWWFMLIVIVGIIISLYFGARKTVTYFNYQEYQKTVIDSLNKQSISKKDSVIARLTEQKQKVKIIRQNITIKPEEDRIKKSRPPVKRARQKRNSYRLFKPSGIR